ncbi:MAG: hypothetical protein WAU58_13325 [Terriglobales bacterium]
MSRREDQFNWRLSLYAALGAFIVLIPVAIWTSEELFYVLVVAPIISFLLCFFVLGAAVHKKLRTCLSLLLMLVVYWAVSAALIMNYQSVRSAARWSLWSRYYKADVLEQPDSRNGYLKHVEWDGWGMFAQNTYVFLVFDPTDSLGAAAKNHRPGKFNGIPCEVDRVRRLESHWYSVQFFTSEYWGQTPCVELLTRVDEGQLLQDLVNAH